MVKPLVNTQCVATADCIWLLSCFARLLSLLWFIHPFVFPFVCSQANELDLAIDVYQQMLAEGCTPNVVTYNTLIDVYGKTGQWEEAVAVLDTLERQVLTK